MTEAPQLDVYDVTCPHCGKDFRAELLGGGVGPRGFKCPHCKLFVPLERAAGSDAAA